MAVTPDRRTPEELARVNIDAALRESGWIVQDRRDANLQVEPPWHGRGVLRTQRRQQPPSWRAVALILFLSSVRADETAPAPEAINNAIDSGVKWLKAAQREDGSWGSCVSGATYGGGGGGPCYYLGPTAFSVFTLAVCGTARDDPAIVQGLNWLEKRQRESSDASSYEDSVIVLMLTALNPAETPTSPRKLPRSSSPRRPPPGSRFPPDEWRWMDDRLRHLATCAYHTGGFGYGAFEPHRPDVSATQFACLALRAASFAGYPVEKVWPDGWADTAEFLAGLQDRSGGFPYERGYGPSRGMTAAALSTLIICREQMALVGDENPPRLNDAIQKGLAHLDATFDVASNPSPHFKTRDFYHYCHLYAIERTGTLAGRREFGGNGWYSQGAAFLLRDQGTSGRWSDGTCMRPTDVLGTCFALLFLKKATIPVVTSRG